MSKKMKKVLMWLVAVVVIIFSWVKFVPNSTKRKINRKLK